MPPKLVDESWHLDKKVPVAIIVVLVGQFLLGLWFIAKLDSKVEEQSSRLAKTEAQISVIDREAREFGNRIARIEEKTSSMLTILQRLERVLDGRRSETP
jgi:hypothetical protein